MGGASTAVIEISGLCKTFHSLRRGERTALDGFDMVVEKGQVHGFLGPNGSGKTTTLRTLLGLLRADEGVMRRCCWPPARRYGPSGAPSSWAVSAARPRSARRSAGPGCG
jgi:ABC-type multidrug transport system ATPase subunit